MRLAIAGCMEVVASSGSISIKPQIDLRLFQDKDSIRTLTSFIVQRDPRDIVNLLIDFRFLSQLLPGLTKVDRQGSRPVWKFVAGEYTFELRTSERNDFSWQLFKSNEYVNAGFSSLRVLPFDRGTLVTIVANEPFHSDSVLSLFKNVFTAENYAIENIFHRFKSLLETSEIPTIEGQPHGSRARFS